MQGRGSPEGLSFAPEAQQGSGGTGASQPGRPHPGLGAVKPPAFTSPLAHSPSRSAAEAPCKSLSWDSGESAILPLRPLHPLLSTPLPPLSSSLYTVDPYPTPRGHHPPAWGQELPSQPSACLPGAFQMQAQISGFTPAGTQPFLPLYPRQPEWLSLAGGLYLEIDPHCEMELPEGLDASCLG